MAKFDAVVLLATMRSGSNLLERILIQNPQLIAAGEPFNKHFLGSLQFSGKLPNPNYGGYTIEKRDSDPEAFLNFLLGHFKPKIPVFRVFHDHDLIPLDLIIDNPRIAKIVLRRNPLDSFISLGISLNTNAWLYNRRAEFKSNPKLIFKEHKYKKWLQATEDFYQIIEEKLELAESTAFDAHYENIKNLTFLNELADYLELDRGFDYFFEPVKQQNPKPKIRYLENPEVLDEVPPPDWNPEILPEKAHLPVVKHAYFAPKLNLVYVPIAGNGEEAECAALRKASLAGIQKIKSTEIADLLENTEGARAYTRVIHPRTRMYCLLLENLLGKHNAFDMPFPEIITERTNFELRALPESLDRKSFRKVELVPNRTRKLLREFIILVRKELWNGQRNHLVNDQYWPQVMIVDNLKQSFPLIVIEGDEYPAEKIFEPLHNQAPIVDQLRTEPFEAEPLIQGMWNQQLLDLCKEDFESYRFELEDRRTQ